MKIIDRNNYKITKVVVTFFLISVLGGCKATAPSASNPKPTIPETAIAKDWQKALKYSFRENYSILTQKHASVMHEKYPVIIQDLLNMTLVRSNGGKVRFEMQKEAYYTLAHTSHPPLTVYSILCSSDFKVTHDTTVHKLENYASLIQNSLLGVPHITHLNKVQKGRIAQVLTLTQAYVEKVLEKRNTSEEEFQTFATSIRPLIKSNLYDGAMEQLSQFMDQMNLWKKTFPDENWPELRVVVLGFHQPRDSYALKLFFQWLLNEPEIENHVVYAEFQFSIFGENRKKAEELALELLTKVDFEKDISRYLFDDETYLQRDVMGPGAKEILGNWGESPWFRDENKAHKEK